MGGESLLLSAKSTFNTTRQANGCAGFAERRRGWLRDLDAAEVELTALEQAREREYLAALARVAQLETRAAAPQAYGHLLAGCSADIGELLEDFESRLEQERGAQLQFQESVRAAVLDRLRRAEQDLQAEHRHGLAELAALQTSIGAALAQHQSASARDEVVFREKLTGLGCEAEEAFAQLEQRLAGEGGAAEELEGEVQEALVQLEEQLATELSEERAESDQCTNMLLGELEEALIRLESAWR